MSEHFTLEISAIRQHYNATFLFCFFLHRRRTERILAHPSADSVLPVLCVIWRPFPVDASALCQEGRGLKREEGAGMMPTGDGGRMNDFEARLRFLRL